MRDARIAALFTLSTTEFVKFYRKSDFETKLSIWVELRRRILDDGETDLFEKYLFPLLSPIIYSAINHFMQTFHDSYEAEDFEQEIKLDFYIHLADYNPYYKEQAFLGEVFFRSRIRTVYSRFKRDKEKRFNHVSMNMSIQDEDKEYIELGDALEDTSTDIHTQFMKDEVLHMYGENKAKYTESYARKKTREWSETNGFDIFS